MRDLPKRVPALRNLWGRNTSQLSAKAPRRARVRFAAVKFAVCAALLPLLCLVLLPSLLFRSFLMAPLSIGDAGPDFPAHVVSTSEFKPIAAKYFPPFTIFVYDPPARDSVSNAIANYGSWDTAGTALLVAALDSLRGTSSHVVDFGANLGWFSFVAAVHGAHVTAIEALPGNARAIRLGLAANRPLFNTSNIRLVEAALVGDKRANPGTASDRAFRVCLDRVHRNAANYGNALLPLSGEIPSALCAQWVAAVRLDDVVETSKPLAFLKADCEGCEAGALFGAERLLTGPAAPCVILMEWFPRIVRRIDYSAQRHTQGMIRILISGSFHVYLMDPVRGGRGITLQGPISPSQYHTFFTSRGMQAVVILQGSERCFPPGSHKLHTFFQQLRTPSLVAPQKVHAPRA